MMKEPPKRRVVRRAYQAVIAVGAVAIAGSASGIRSPSALARGASSAGNAVALSCPAQVLSPAVPFSCRLREAGISTRLLPGPWAYRVTNQSGTVVETGTLQAPRNPRDRRALFLSLRAPVRYGLYTLRFFRARSAAIVPTAPQPLFRFAVVPKAAGRLSERLGMNANLAPLALDPSALQARIAWIRDQGLGWYRIELNGADSPESGSPSNWTATDAVVEAAWRAHLNVLGLLVGWPGNRNPFGPQANTSFDAALASYLRFVRAAVRRYERGGTLAHALGLPRAGITAWELWNEPTTAIYWPGSAAQYAVLAQRAADLIRRLDPGATVLAYADAPKTLLTLDAPAAFNALALHYYPGASSPDNPVASVYTAEAPVLADEVATDQPLPIWLTETGWSTEWVTPTQQADDWARVALDAEEQGIRVLFFFSEAYPGSGYGEFTGAGTPKPAVVTTAAVSHMLAGSQAAGSVDLGSAVRVLLFTRPGGGTLAALWGLGGTRGTFSLHVPAGTRLHADDAFGNPIVSARPLLTLRLSPSPVYLVAPHTTPQSFESLLTHGSLRGFSPISAHVIPSVGPDPTDLSLTIADAVNHPIRGRLTVRLPSGWTPSRTVIPFGVLEPGAAKQVIIPVRAMRIYPSNRYPIAVTITGRNLLRTVRADVALWAAPRLTASARSPRWAYPLYLDRPSEVVGIPGWSPTVARARLAVGWSRAGLRVEANVHIRRFYEPYQGAALWQGSSLQLYFEPRSSTHPGVHERETSVGLGDTPAGPEVYEWSGPEPGLVTTARLSVTRPGPHTWRYGVTLPWAAIGLHPRAGYRFGFDALLNVVKRTQRVGWLALAPGAGNTNQPNLFPSMTLLGDP